jgi:hypothetical protein
MLAGVSRPILLVWLTNAQQAYADLMIGVKVVSCSYEGKSASFTQADAPRLEAWIALLQAQISGRRSRRALRPFFT